VIGAVVAIALVGRHRLAADLALGLAAFGVPMALIGVWPREGAAILAMAIVGMGNTIVDVSAVTLMQRAIPDAVRARVFGVLQSLLLGTIALGAAIAPALIAVAGIRWALVIAGALLPALALISARALARIDAATVAPVHRVERLRAIPIFAPLPPAA